MISKSNEYVKMSKDPSVLSRCSCSEAHDKLLGVSQDSVRQHGGQRHVASLFVHQGSLLLCAAPSHVCPSVRFYFALTLSLLTVCAFYLFLSSHLPKHKSLSVFLFLFLSPSSPLLSFHPLIRPPLCHSSTRLLPRSLAPPARGCGGPQKRSGQMVSEDFRALLISTGNSLVLLLHDALTGSLQVHESNRVTLTWTWSFDSGAGSSSTSSCHVHSWSGLDPRVWYFYIPLFNSTITFIKS